MFIAVGPRQEQQRQGGVFANVPVVPQDFVELPSLVRVELQAVDHDKLVLRILG